MSNNTIKSFSELDHLVSLINVHGKQFLRLIHFILIAIMIVTISKKAGLEKLKDVLFLGNPMYDEATDKVEARLRVLARLPQVTKIDGQLVKPSEIEASTQYMVL
jgi:hypothetical protein